MNRLVNSINRLSIALIRYLMHLSLNNRTIRWINGIDELIRWSNRLLNASNWLISHPAASQQPANQHPTSQDALKILWGFTEDSVKDHGGTGGILKNLKRFDQGLLRFLQETPRIAQGFPKDSILEHLSKNPGYLAGTPTDTARISDFEEPTGHPPGFLKDSWKILQY